MSDISYELAIELKRAGFPQKIVWGKFAYQQNEELVVCTRPNAIAKDNEADPNTSGLILVPTLEELIEECGRNFDSLNIVRDGYSALWLATDEPTSYEGKTSTEAVANLYLALKNNPAK